MNLKRILAVMLAVAVIGTVTALAASDGSGAEAGATQSTWGERQINPFDKLVEDGVVSQSTYNKMKVYLEENMPQKTQRLERVHVLDTLLEAGIITQTEYNAMEAAMPVPEKPNVELPALGEGVKLPDDLQRVNIFESFVEDGVISERTAAAILEYLKSSLPDMPDKAEIKENARERGDLFSAMLEAGVITQAEYDAIKGAMPERPATTNRSGKPADNNQ